MEKINGETKIVRCAIYTRKSTSDGLEKDFTSLDAQRESAESYIKSQKNLGWSIVSDYYDDGGFTGANTERPALQKLLEDIQGKKIDCVVVYKVDRLSRSLLDFVKLLKFFEEQQITFVSVTQHFDTNSSMGRLTLNILLSFAQFEREMISERTKDKMRASRIKGKWIGGRAPLGYDVDRTAQKLVANPKEAELVRFIFNLYLEKKSLLEVARTLNEMGHITKQYPFKGLAAGGVKFKNSNIQMMVNSVTYIGKVGYEGKVYPGEHEAILSEEIFNQAQELLKLNKRERGVSKNKKFEGILSRLFRCACCHASMCHGYAKKKNNVYRYYTCLTALKRNRKDCPIKSVSASVIENKCLDILRYITSDERIEKERWKALNLEEQIAALRSLVRQINYDGQKGKLHIELFNDSRKHEFELPLAELKSRLRITDAPNLEQEPPIRRQLLLAHQIHQMLDDGQAKNLNQLAGWLGVSKTRLDQITNLLFLCPKIQEDIINGDRLQIERIGERTIRPLSVEIDWQKQISAWKKLLSGEALSA